MSVVWLELGSLLQNLAGTAWFLTASLWLGSCGSLAHVSLSYSHDQSASQLIPCGWHFHSYIIDQKSHTINLDAKGKGVCSTRDEAMARRGCRKVCRIEDSDSVIVMLLPSVCRWGIWIQRGWTNCTNHTAGKEWRWDSDPGLLGTKGHAFPPDLPLTDPIKSGSPWIISYSRLWRFPGISSSLCCGSWSCPASWNNPPAVWLSESSWSQLRTHTWQASFGSGSFCSGFLPQVHLGTWNTQGTAGNCEQTLEA